MISISLLLFPGLGLALLGYKTVALHVCYAHYICMYVWCVLAHISCMFMCLCVFVSCCLPLNKWWLGCL